MHLVVKEAVAFLVEIFLDVAIPEESRCYWIEVVGVSAPSYIRFKIPGGPGWSGRTIILVKVFVIKFQAVVGINTISKQGIPCILVLIGYIVCVVPQDLIAVPKPD